MFTKEVLFYVLFKCDCYKNDENVMQLKELVVYTNFITNYNTFRNNFSYNTTLIFSVIEVIYIYIIVNNVKRKACQVQTNHVLSLAEHLT